MQAEPVVTGPTSDFEADLSRLTGSRFFHVLRLGMLIVASVAVIFSFTGQPALVRETRDRTLAEPTTMKNLAHLGLSVHAFALYFVILGLVLTLVCYAVAAIIVVRRSSQPMALFVALQLVLLGATFGHPIGVQGSRYPALSWLNGALAGLSIETILLLLYLFPDGRFAPRWTRWPALASLLVLVPTSTLPSSRFNPDHWPTGIYVAIVATLMVTGVVAQFDRYRRISVYTARQQTKWVILSFSVAMGAYLIVTLIAVAVPAFQPGTIVQMAAAAIIVAGMCLIPVSFGISILRYHLWDIDVLIGRTLVYGSLTAILSGLYAALVGLFQRIFLEQTGSTSNLSIVITTMIVAASFTTVKNGVQTIVDRRYKPATVAAHGTPGQSPAVAAPAPPNADGTPGTTRFEELSTQLALLRSELANRSEAEHELREMVAHLEARLGDELRGEIHHPDSQEPR